MLHLFFLENHLRICAMFKEQAYILLIIIFQCLYQAVCVAPLLQMLLLLAFKDNLSADFALSTVPIALDGVGYYLVSWDHFFAVGAFNG